MRLIDADKLESGEVIIPTENGGYEYVEVFYKDDVDNAPSVDAVEVVRCKDCKFCTYEPYKDLENVYICNRTYWSRSDGGLLSNHYCSWGERREDETD